METHSGRHYKVVMLFSGAEESEEVNMSLSYLMRYSLGNTGKDEEYMYALQDKMDEILDLKVNEMLVFNPIRDVEHIAKGIIMRTH